MKQVTAVIVDDEVNSIRNLTSLLRQYCPGVHLVATATSLSEAEQAFRTHQPDVLFLDIEMPLGTGFELLERLEGQQVQVIFTTAYDTYAVKAFRSHAIDYLLKPIDVDQLREAVEKVKPRPAAPLKADARGAADAGVSKLLLPRLNGFELVATDGIAYLQSSGNYTHIHLRDGQKYVLSKNIGELEKALPGATFLRIHNEHIVNIDEIARYVKGRGGYVILKNGQHLEVAYRRKKDLLERLGYERR